MNMKLKNVLLIDDDHTTNVYHTVIIKRSQITDQVQTMEYPEIALEHLMKVSKVPDRKGMGPFMPELIFLDVNMPRMTGWEFLEEFNKIYQGSILKPIIYMLTASMQPTDQNVYILIMLKAI